MLVTHEKKNALMANDAWRAAFLPVGGLVECQATKKCYYVVRSFRLAAVLWPAVQIELGLYSRDPSASSLVWTTCFNFAEFVSIGIKVLSPLGGVMQDRPPLVIHTAVCFI